MSGCAGEVTAVAAAAASVCAGGITVVAAAAVSVCADGITVVAAAAVLVCAGGIAAVAAAAVSVCAGGITAVAAAVFDLVAGISSQGWVSNKKLVPKKTATAVAAKRERKVPKDRAARFLLDISGALVRGGDNSHLGTSAPFGARLCTYRSNVIMYWMPHPKPSDRVAREPHSFYQ